MYLRGDIFNSENPFVCVNGYVNDKNRKAVRYVLGSLFHERADKKLDRLYDFNMTRPTEQEKREAMLMEMFAEIGEGCYIEPPFYANNEHDEEYYFKDRKLINL